MIERNELLLSRANASVPRRSVSLLPFIEPVRDQTEPVLPALMRRRAARLIPNCQQIRFQRVPSARV